MREMSRLIAIAPPMTDEHERQVTVADLFCGAGGSSTGARRAIERRGKTMKLVAVNHWPIAVETHQANHPEARHYVQDLEAADPEALVPEGRLDILMASPECRFYSRARGGKPVKDQGRMNPWIVQRWLTSLDVKCLIVENVPEFTDWCPLLPNGKPDRQKRGLYFEEWIRSLWGLGYQAEWRCLNAADYGEATTRVRFFLIARKDGLPIRWPEPTHAREARPGLMPGLSRWRAAREIIDWSDRGRSLFDDPKYQTKPLAVRTRQRIARGLARYGGEFSPLYIRLLDLEDPALPDVRPVDDDHQPPAFILNRHGENGSDRTHPMAEPVPTATTRGAGYLVKPVVSAFVGANRTGDAPRSPEEPIPTCTGAGSGGGLYLVRAEAQPFTIGQQSDTAPRNLDEPAPTVATAAGDISLVEPVVMKYFGTSDAQDIDEPLSTVVSVRKHALVEPTVVKYYSNSDAQDINQPLSTVTTKARHALVSPEIDPMEQAHHEAIQQSIDPRRVILLDGTPHLLDIRFRMLRNTELARSMGFEDDELQYEFAGNATQVTKQIGNAVPVRLAAALVEAVLDEATPHQQVEDTEDSRVGAAQRAA